MLPDALRTLPACEVTPPPARLRLVAIGASITDCP